jgi:hypothetical protein
MATQNLRHMVLLDGSANGWESGTQRCLEQEIIKQTNGTGFDVSAYRQTRALERRFGHGTRFEVLRDWLPKKKLKLPQVDVLWLVLMGPENYRLDLFRGWEDCARYKVLYVFDTLPSQYDCLRRLLSDSRWNLCIGSFNDAVPVLERLTGRKWHHVDQAVAVDLFKPATVEERVIHFSAYGRRHPAIHEAVLEFAETHGLYYDFTMHERPHPTADPMTVYRQFAWHLSHSLFTFSWPVELTNPARAGSLSPITCRWFEAAAAGTVVLGQAPRNRHFEELFGRDFVTPISPDGSRISIMKQLESVWSSRFHLAQQALDRRASLAPILGWSARVERMSQLIDEYSRRDLRPEASSRILIHPNAPEIS